jgi:hypothetical protein
LNPSCQPSKGPQHFAGSRFERASFSKQQRVSTKLMRQDVPKIARQSQKPTLC